MQVGRGIANQSEAIREKKAGKLWNKVGAGLVCLTILYHSSSPSPGVHLQCHTFRVACLAHSSPAVHACLWVACLSTAVLQLHRAGVWLKWRSGACCPVQETHEWEDPPGTDIQAYDAEAAARQLGIPQGPDYYALLEVTRDADAATIKRQYYILARKWHPGKGCRLGWLGPKEVSTALQQPQAATSVWPCIAFPWTSSS